jgi:hypothetical protein
MPDPPKRRRRQPKIGEFGSRRQPNVKEVTEDELRELFARKRILERLAAGEITQEIIRDGHPSPPRANEPVCTKSQIIEYSNADGQKIAKAHRYVRPDGEIGASGMPDPKEILHEGVRHLLPVKGSSPG